ncbi:MAG: DUF6036 family nucleotidyltransferase [Arenicellales bacterium]
MKRRDLEHIIRAAGAVTESDELIIIGSQAILGQWPEAPVELLQSTEADIIPVEHPDRADLIAGVIGEGSPFHEQYGYYADGVEERTAILPRGWKSRLVPIVNPNTRGIRGLCLDVHDLLIAKYCAARPKDLEFTAAVARHGLADEGTLLQRLTETDLEAENRKQVRARIQRDFT